MWVMKNWLPLVFGPALAMESEPIFVLIWAPLGLVLELVAGTAAAAGGGIAALNHEVVDDPMKDGAVIEAFTRQEYEIVDGLGGVLREKLANDFSFRCFKRGRVLARPDQSPWRAVLNIAWT